MIVTGKTEMLGVKSVPVSNMVTQIPYYLGWDRTQAYVMVTLHLYVCECASILTYIRLDHLQ